MTTIPTLIIVSVKIKNLFYIIFISFIILILKNKNKSYFKKKKIENQIYLINKY
jgi:hypothetical protein